MISRTMMNQTISIFVYLGLIASVSAFSGAKEAWSTKCGSELAMQSTIVSRRSWIGGLGIATAFSQGLTQKAQATDPKLVTYRDESCGFQIDIPAEWEMSEQSLADRRKIVFFIDPSKSEEKTLFFIAFTPLRDDFTSISSFGSVDQVCV